MRDNSPHPTFALIIPTLNAEPDLDALLPAIAAQSVQPDRFIVIDSSSNDMTARRFKDAGADVTVIPKSEFNHGSTRNRAVRMAPDDVEIVILLTQDAYPASPDAFANLLAAFKAPNMALAYGRQLPKPHADPIEAYARLHNYPDVSDTRSKESIPELGFKTCFCSNSFAAYRRDTLLGAGGFRDDLILGEDAAAAAEFILDNKQIAYVANARVYHSHGYTLRQEFKRYFDIGAMHIQAQQIMEPFGTLSDAGGRYVRGELTYLARTAPWLIPEACVRTLAKYIGYRIGRHYRRLPQTARMRLSMHSYHWTQT